MTSAGPIRESGDGVLVTVRVRPRSRPGVERASDAVVIRVASPPIAGRATEEARKALAVAVGVPPSRVTLVSGSRSRTKVFRVEGVSRRELDAALAGQD